MTTKPIGNVKIDETVKIRDQFFAGKAALEKEQTQNLFRSFEQELKNVVSGNLFQQQPDLIAVWQEIFDSVFAGQLANSLSEQIDHNNFYDFGDYISHFLRSENQDFSSPLNKLAHGYLNILRLSPFLVKISGKNRWEKLILDLIVLSNFTVAELFDQRVKEYENKTLFKVIRGSAETDYTWRQVSVLVESYSLSLLKFLSDFPGKVAFLMENSLQMALLDLASLTSGFVNIMIPANSVPAHISFILNQTEATLLIISDEKQLFKIRSIKNEIPHIKRVVLLQGNCSEEWAVQHKNFVSLGANIQYSEVLKLREQVKMDSLASIMYTSGTTGEPKGIMFSQLNIVYKRFCRALALPEIGDYDRFLAYLPLYHTFGRFFELMGSVFWGATYAFMENPAVDTMIANMSQVKPTIFISIPKKWTQLYDRIIENVDIEIEDEQKILHAVRNVTGGKLRWGISAAGFLSPEIFQFFQKYGVELMSGFGMTEATGGITMTPPGQYSINSLGKALPGIKIKLGEDGELLINGPYVMLGYFRRKNEETFKQGGWFPTGDVMRMEETGFIEIIDRKKEIYKNIKGETIAPQKIENYFRDFDFVKQVFLVGDRRPFNTVLIYPNYELENSVISDMTDSQKQEYFASVIVTVNKFLAPYERIVDFRFIDRAFTTDKGELTPKSTYKRRVIEKNFNDIVEEMYTKNYISIKVSKIEVRIPNWFLREKGCLSGDVIAIPHGLSIPKLQLTLKIEKSGKSERNYQIGDYFYEVKSGHIDLQVLLTNPLYWLGNQDFFNFAGEGILLWYRQDSFDKSISFYSIANKRVIDLQIKEEMNIIINAGEQSLYGLHYAVILLQSDTAIDGFLAVQYIQLLLEDETLLIYKLALKLSSFPNLTDLLYVRRELFKATIKLKKRREFQDFFELYLSYNYDLLDDQVIHSLVDIGRGWGFINAIESILEKMIVAMEKDEKKDLEHSAIPSLFDLLSNYGIHHPTSVKIIRQTIVRYQLGQDWQQLVQLADQARTHLRNGFRNWLGANQTMAVDVETGEEYGWHDVIITEQDLDPGEKDRIVKAITETSIVREAIFLFSEGTLIRLNDILPGGIWVSFIDSYHDKTVYRITVQTRFQGSFEIILKLNKKLTREAVVEEISWLILAGSKYFGQEIVEDFGGYWREFDLWSGKFVPGDSVAKFLHRETRKKDEQAQLRLYYLWPFFVWNASASYLNFWKLTGYKLHLANPAPDNFIVPTHDYQTRTRVVSFSERVETSSLVDFINNFYLKFIKSTQKTYPFLARKSIWNYLFSGVVDGEGEKNGLRILNRFLEDIRESDPIENSKDILKALDNFLKNVRENGFIPKQLFFAIKRFHRWLELNQNASLSAQAQTLYDLYETYHLLELEKSYPETRTRFFLETAFQNSSENLKKALKELVKNQHEKNLSKQDTLAFIANFQNEFELNDKETFFFTRLSYPYLKPTDSAALLKMRSEGTQIANLVVQLEDYDGNSFSIRRPVSPKEISRLHQLYIDANLLVHFHADHQFLVAISERGFIIGGLFYIRTGDQSVNMEKIVVADRYRRKGISEGLMNEFFNRMKSEQAKFVTTGFFRPEYFYRFGFKIKRKYSGLVKEL